MDERINLCSSALLCGTKSRLAVKMDENFDHHFVVTEFVDVVSGEDVEKKAIFRTVSQKHRITPRIDAKEFTLARMFATNSVPVAVPTAGCVGKVDAAMFGNSIAMNIDAQFDAVLQRVNEIKSQESILEPEAPVES